ncbi:hypothetical protein TrCOL_g1335 [Triparma columacea]|uniref:ABC transporter domain-containing protein n=1 Tax=Triparma columacea TaxID=722753 RepID=A0A9W7GKB8_9STRA|nr:hypothetical protein TrCOL_g1335 [Triparma columacea]
MNFKAGAGEVVGIVGKNGSGKSTVAMVLKGLKHRGVKGGKGVKGVNVVMQEVGFVDVNRLSADPLFGLKPNKKRKLRRMRRMRMKRMAQTRLRAKTTKKIVTLTCSMLTKKMPCLTFLHPNK